MSSLKIENLSASIEGKVILENLNLDLPAGEVHAIMGPNGSGKSTLSKVLAGHPDYLVTEGSAKIDGTDFTDAVLSRIQQKQLCSMASGTNSLTGVETAYSLGC